MPEKFPEKVRDQAMLYVLEALENGEKKQFEQLLLQHPELQTYVAELKNTLNLTNISAKVKPPEYVLEGQRNLLRGKIEQLETQTRSTGLSARLADFWYSATKRVLIPRQPAWAVATYVLMAFLVGRLVFPTVRMVSAPVAETSQPDIQQLLESGSLTSADIDYSANNPESVNLNLKTVSDYNLQGGLDDKSIRQVLFYMLKNDDNPGNRMKAVNLISEAQPIEEGRIVLISSLLTDPNPGVRLRAAKSLNAYEADKTLRDACIKVLFEDENEAVRMAALSILTESPTEDLIPALEIISQMDKNEFIRDQASRIVDSFARQIAVERIEEQ